MFHLRNLLISLFSPAAIFIIMMFIDWIFKTRVSSVSLILVYLQHTYLGKLLGVDLHGDSGAWISLPYNGWFLLFNLLADYLIVALAVYVLLTLFTMRISSARKFL